MIRIINVGMELRLVDVAVAVALLLLIAMVLIRVFWQPVHRLAVIRWSLLSGLLLGCGLVSPWNMVFLGVVDRPQAVTPAAIEVGPAAPRSSVANASRREVTADGQIAAIKRDATPSAQFARTNRKQSVASNAVADSVGAADGSNIWLRWVFRIYLSGVGLMSIWLAIGQWTVFRLVRRAQLPDVELSDVWSQIQAEMHIGDVGPRVGRGQLLISDDIALPVAVGVFWPAVIVPRWSLVILTRAQLRPILAHELAHIGRHDATLRWIAAVFQIVFYYQPCYWWLRRELRLCQEFLADAQAMRYAMSATDYAEQLVVLMKAAPAPKWRPSSAIGILETRSELYRRIQMLVKSPQQINLQPGLTRSRGAAALLLTLSIAMGLVTLRAADDPPVADLQSVAPEHSQPPSPHELPGIEFQVVDSKRRPVAGAKVQVWGMSVAGGAFIGLPQNELPLPTTQSDAAGMARVVLPAGQGERQQRLLRDLIGSGPKRVGLKIDHPRHPVWSDEYELGSDEPIVLADSTTMHVRAQKGSSKSALRRLYPALEGASVDWSEADGVVTLRRLNLSGPQAARGLRILQVPETGPVLFSELIDLKANSGNPLLLIANMQPSVRLRGRLGEQVPRPIKDGRVVATVVAGYGTAAQWCWQSLADIAADGTFVLDSLPAEENVQLIALCDGWVSSSPTEAEVTEYVKRYQLPKLDTRGMQSTTVFPQLCRLTNPQNELTISMQRTASCQVTVLDEFGQGIPDAVVAFSPNQVIFGHGSTTVGAGGDRLTQIRAELQAGRNLDSAPVPSNREGAYTAKTNKQGVATISNVPAGSESGPTATRDLMFFVIHDRYTATTNRSDIFHGDDNEFDVTGIPSLAPLTPGQTAKVTVSMQRVTDQQATPFEIAKDELAGKIVDQEGRPMEGVQVLVWEQDEEQIRTDRNGVFRKQFENKYGDDRHLLVRFKKPGYAPCLIADWELGVNHPQIVLDQRTYFSGIVRRSDGRPAANVLVRANQGPRENNRAVIDDIWTETRTDANGHYRLLVQPDSYVIVVRELGIGTAHVPPVGQQAVPIDPADLNGEPAISKLSISAREAKQLDIQLDSGVEFRATIVDGLTGQPVPNVRLWHWQHPGIEGRSDQAGVVTIPMLPAGEFAFSIDAPARYLQAWSPQIPERWQQRANEIGAADGSPPFIPLISGLPFDLRAGMAPATITLQPGVTISGRVVDPDGHAVEGATIDPARSGRGVSLTGDTRHQVSTDQHGLFQIVLPPSGMTAYNLMVHDGKYHQWRTWANGIGEELRTTAGQKIENVELRLNRGGTIRGRTVNRRGQPLANVYVQTTSIDGRENNYYNPASRSDQNGQFVIPYIRPGRHRVHGWMQVRNNGKNVEEFPEVEVQAGGTTEIGNLYIPPRGREPE